MTWTNETVAGIYDQAMTDAVKSDRNEWSAAKKIGVSDVGHCREYVRRMILDEEFTDEDNRYEAAALIGTLLGDAIERRIVERHPEAEMQATVEVNLDLGEGFQLQLIGHPDICWPDALWDTKTKDGLGVVQRVGAQQNHRWQVSLYAKARIDAGLLAPDATLSLIYLDRSGADRDPYIETWQYNEADVEEAKAWFMDVIYAIRNGEEASRDKPREFCFAACPYASACRGDDTDVEGLITDEEALAAIDTYLQAMDMNRSAEKMKSAAKSALRNVSGSTGTHLLRWTHVGPVVVKESYRAPHDKIDLKPIRRKK